MRMRRGNLHTHSTFSDGMNTMEEIVLAAIDRGFAYLGFSEHIYVEPNESFRIQKENIPAYFAEARRLREAYAGKIEIYAGFENEYYSLYPKEEQDFSIGSVHDLRDGATGAYYSVDGSPRSFENAVNKVAGGDIRLLARKYYGFLAEMAERYRPDVVGHFDLIGKNNGDGRYFDENSDWYRDIVSEACERIAAADCVVELNTGGIARGYLDRPYPSRRILERLRELRVPVTISSDSHSAGTLDCWFDEAEELLRGCGFRSVRQLSGGEWIDVEL